MSPTGVVEGKSHFGGGELFAKKGKPVERQCKQLQQRKQVPIYFKDLGRTQNCTAYCGKSQAS